MVCINRSPTCVLPHAFGPCHAQLDEKVEPQIDSLSKKVSRVKIELCHKFLGLL